MLCVHCTYSADCVETRQGTVAVSPADDLLDFAPTESASSNPSAALQCKPLVINHKNNQKCADTLLSQCILVLTQTVSIDLLHLLHCVLNIGLQATASHITISNCVLPTVPQTHDLGV